MHQDLQHLISGAKDNTLDFQYVMNTIRRHYECTPVAFTTGAGTSNAVENPAGTNAASCALLAFARRLQLDPATALGLYGEHYRSVLATPDGRDHGNIRAFMAHGWAGVTFAGEPLRLKGPA